MRNLGNDNCQPTAQARLAVQSLTGHGPTTRRGRRTLKPRSFFGVIASLAFLFAVLGGFTKAITGDLSNLSDLVAAADLPAKPLSAVDVQSVSKGNLSGVREPQQSVIRTQAEWLELWRKHANDFNAAPPTILFDQEVVAAVFLGEKPTGGYDITIVRAERSDDELVIYYQEKSPLPGSILVQVFTQPFHMVRINRQDLAAKVTFRRES